MPKVALVKGEQAFRDFIEKMKQMNPLNALESKEELKVPIPEEPKTWTDKGSIGEAVSKKKADLKEKFSNFSFHFDVGSPSAEISFILQLVDDTPFKGSRQKNIINPDLKYVGINSFKVKNKNCGYFLFSN